MLRIMFGRDFKNDSDCIQFYDPENHNTFSCELKNTPSNIKPLLLQTGMMSKEDIMELLKFLNDYIINQE